MAMVREDAVRAALRVLDEVGLENLSLRKLAKELGIQAPTLYWHFKNKQELLDEMAAMAMAGAGDGALPAPGGEWDQWLAWMARRIRRGMLAHRDGALLASASRPAVDRWADVEEILVMLRKAGFTPADAMRGIGTLTNYVLGTTLEEQQAANREPGQPDFGAYPVLREAVVALEAADPEWRFEHGLSLILDGMRAQLA
ncbi:MAG: TetR/AcrR family transcriptional regulator, tetracycline repressor protein [Actinomycetota bacterium]|jgi:TetR/AcrR family tetracycline transcriptional repressor|nr:TetR/AcrR family transcriptional regulator, tetracycline repressor protein [Actinomycetota bacterium]